MSRRVTVTFLIAVAVVASSASVQAEPKAPAALGEGAWPSGVEAAAPVGVAFAISRSDGNDVPGALDLRSMRVARSKTKDTITFSTHDAVSNADIEVSSANFAVLIDVNDDRDYEFGQYVFFASGRLRGALVDLRSDRVVDRTAPASRTGAAGFRTVIQRGKIDSPGTYRFALFGYNEAAPCSGRRPCIDAIPNRFPLVALDHRAPTADLDPIAAYASDEGADASVAFGFTVEDDRFGTGVKRWTVQSKDVGADNGWANVDSGRSASPTVSFTGTPGVTYDLRVVVTDRQRNRQVSGRRRTSFPLDDRDGAIVYGGATGQATPGAAFLATTTTLSMGATATIEVDVEGPHEVCVVGGPTAADASATWTVDATPMADLDEHTTTPARTRFGCTGALSTGQHTIVLTGASAEPFVVDAIYVKPV